MGQDLVASLTETIARHFSGATVSGNRVDVGFAGLAIRCEIDSVREVGEVRSAAFYLDLSGDALGPGSIRLEGAGYGRSPVEAIVSGGCNWACAFGPVLEAGLADRPLEGPARFRVDVQGVPTAVLVDAVDRVLLGAGPGVSDVSAFIRDARDRLGARPWLVSSLMEADDFPELAPGRPTVLSIFVFDMPGHRSVDVSVHGVAWAPGACALVDAPEATANHAAMLRELAVLRPDSSPASADADSV